MKPQRPALRLLERHIERFLPEDLELYFDDLVDASERIWDVLDNYKEVVEALESTNEPVSHRFQRRPADPDRVQHRLPARDADREPLGHERRAPGRRQPGDRVDLDFWIVIAASVARSRACSASSVEALALAP